MITYVVMTEWVPSERTKRSLIWRIIHFFARYHVLVLIRKGDVWVLVDPQSNGMQVRILTPGEMATFLLANKVVESARIEGEPDTAEFHWFELISCVTITKRIIGLKDWRVKTPMQLMRRLRNG